jgi:hypothetical protein
MFGIPASSRRQIPDTPTIGTATDVGTSRAYNNGAAIVSFTSSAVGFETESYTVTSSPGGFTATGASSPLTVTGLQSNVAYTFTVTATNFVGTTSASSASNSITATTVPQAPTIGTPTLANSQAYTGSANIGVVFTAGATGGKSITSYNVISSSANTGSGATSPISVSETVGTARTYTVTASNSNGTSLASSASSSITPSSVPQTPTITSVTNVGGRPASSPQASVAFTGNATGGSAITGYTVTSSSGASNTGATSPIVVTESGTNTYTYTVAATNARGTSIASTGINAFIASVPTPPTIGTLSNVTGIAYGSNPQFTLTFTVPTSTGGSAISAYKYSTDGGTTYATASGTASPLTLTTQSTSGTPAFVAGSSYTVILKAVNGNGDGEASSASNSATAATAPSTPTFALTSSGNTNITGTYTYNTGGLAVTSYASTISPTISTTIGGTSPVGNVSGALTYTASYVQGTQYTVPLSITNAIGTATATSQTITPFAATAPGAPASLSAAVASTTSVTLTYGAIAQNGSALTAWTGSGTSTGDIVSTPAINLTYSGTPSTAGSTVTVTGAFAATTSYTFTLKVRNSVGASSTVTSGSVTPLPVITDNFNRTGVSLGTSSSGSAWTSLRGTWATNGTQAVSSDAGSTYALSSVAFGNANTTVSADVSGGTGVAFWVTDSGSWWAATTYYNQTVNSTYNSCCSTSPVCSPGSYPIDYGAANCVATPGTTTYSYQGASTSSRSCDSGGGSTRCSGATGGASICYVLSYTCPSGQSYSGGSCYSNYYPYYVTSNKPTCSETTYTAAFNYSCSGSCSAGQSGPYTGSSLGLSQASCWCGTTSATTYNCTCSQGTPSSTNTSSATCSGTGYCTYPNCSNCGGGTIDVCNACYQDVYSQYYYLRLYSSASGTVTTPVSDVNLGAPAAAIKVITSGNNVTAQAYSNTSMTTPLGSALTATNTGTKGTSSGIIKTPSNYSQGTTVDNFSTGA